jgi:hypothetical protein
MRCVQRRPILLRSRLSRSALQTERGDRIGAAGATPSNCAHSVGRGQRADSDYKQLTAARTVSRGPPRGRGTVWRPFHLVFFVWPKERRKCSPKCSTFCVRGSDISGRSSTCSVANSSARPGGICGRGGVVSTCVVAANISLPTKGVPNYNYQARARSCLPLCRSSWRSNPAPTRMRAAQPRNSAVDWVPVHGPEPPSLCSRHPTPAWFRPCVSREWIEDRKITGE